VIGFEAFFVFLKMVNVDLDVHGVKRSEEMGIDFRSFQIFDLILLKLDPLYYVWLLRRM
jgi:hypothetical protein